MKRLLLVTNGLIPGGDGLQLHPAVSPWHAGLVSRRKWWFFCTDRNPLAWYAAMLGVSPSALLASACSSLSDETRQCWLASPYHAQLKRDSVHLLAEGSLAWTAEDAAWICKQLNPFLQEEGMRLHAVGAALLLACQKPMQVAPESFARISGKHLPNRLPDGPDAGRFTRLLSEIQMFLHQQQAEHRRERGEVDINGLWFWDACPWPTAVSGATLAVATRNPFLQPLVDGKDARMILTEAERLPELALAGGQLPERVVLAGEGHAVMLKHSIVPWRRKPVWQPQTPAREEELLLHLRGWS